MANQRSSSLHAHTAVVLAIAAATRRQPSLRVLSQSEKGKNKGKAKNNQEQNGDESTQYPIETSRTYGDKEGRSSAQEFSRKWEQTIDINVEGVLYGVAAALPGFQRQGSGHFTSPPVHGGILRVQVCRERDHHVLRQEVGPPICTTVVLPGAIKIKLVHRSSTRRLPMRSQA